MRTKKFRCLVVDASLSGNCSRVSPNSSPSRQQQIESHARQAAEYLKENKPELAAPEFKAIVALDPNNVDARRQPLA